MYTVRHPAIAEEYLVNNVAVNFPNSFSSLSIGQRDVYPIYRKVTARSLYYDGAGISLDEKYGEITNPQKLMVGNFDLAFLFIYLFPLMIVALCFNLYSIEKEQGTLSLIGTLPISVHQIVVIKLLFRFLIIAILAVIYSALGYLVSPVSPSDGFDKLAFWSGIVLLYQAFWFSVCYLIIGFKKNSAFNALSLFCSWLVFLIVIPSFVNNVVEAKYPVSSRMVLLEDLRDKTGIIWDLPNSITYGEYFKTYPNYKKDVPEYFPADGFDRMGTNDSLKAFNTQKLFVWHFYLDKIISKALAAYNQQINAKLRAAATFNFLNPAAVAQEVLNDIAASGHLRYQNFRNETSRYRNTLFEISNRYVFEDKRLSLVDYQRYPHFVMPADEIGTTYAKGSIVLFCLIVLFLSIGYVLHGKTIFFLKDPSLLKKSPSYSL
jgi:ABC-2 type transport system permease protein